MVAGDHRGAAGPGVLAQHRAGERDGAPVEGGEGFVEDPERGGAGEQARERHTLALAGRQCTRGDVVEPVDFEAGEAASTVVPVRRAPSATATASRAG